LTVSNIDKTAPTITATISNGKYTNSNVTVNCSDYALDFTSVTRNKISFMWPKNSIFTLDGIYIVTAMDKAGNNATYTFTIDKTAPTISAINTNNVVVKNGGYANINVTVTVTDSALASKFVTLNGKSVSWPSSSTFSSTGKYVITAKDKYSRISTFTFTIDKTAPKITVKNLSGTVVAKGGSSKGGATFSYSDTNYSSKSITKNGIKITWPTSNKVTSKGTYIIVVTDKAGNKSSFTFKVI